MTTSPRRGRSAFDMLLGFVLGLVAGSLGTGLMLAMVVIGRQSDKEIELENQLTMCRAEIRRLQKKPRENAG